MADKWHEAMCRLLLSEIPERMFLYGCCQSNPRETFMNCRRTAHRETPINLTNATLSKCTHTKKKRVDLLK